MIGHEGGEGTPVLQESGGTGWKNRNLKVEVDEVRIFHKETLLDRLLSSTQREDSSRDWMGAKLVVAMGLKTAELAGSNAESRLGWIC